MSTTQGQRSATTGLDYVRDELRGNPGMSKSNWDDSYALLAPAVFGVALRVTRCRQAAEEICQDVFVQLWFNNGFDHTKGTMRTYLNVTAHRRAIDWVRSEVSARERMRRAAVGVEALEGPEEVAAHNDRCETVRHALRLLPEAQRQAIHLAYFEGLTHREIAQVTGVPLGTTKSRVRDGMIRLSQSLR